MILTPEEIKIVKDFLAPAVKNGLIDPKRLDALIKLAASGSVSQPESLEKLYTVREAADLLGCHPKSVFRYIREGRLSAIKIGPKATRIPHGAIRELINK